jgi:hypothetical protein
MVYTTDALVAQLQGENAWLRSELAATRELLVALVNAGIGRGAGYPQTGPASGSPSSREEPIFDHPNFRSREDEEPAFDHPN